MWLSQGDQSQIFLTFKDLSVIIQVCHDNYGICFCSLLCQRLVFLIYQLISYRFNQPLISSHSHKISLWNIKITQHRTNSMWWERLRKADIKHCKYLNKEIRKVKFRIHFNKLCFGSSVRFMRLQVKFNNVHTTKYSVRLGDSCFILFYVQY